MYDIYIYSIIKRLYTMRDNNLSLSAVIYMRENLIFINSNFI